MTILPIAVGATIHKTNDVDKYYGYIHEMMLLASFATIGFLFNIWLYIDDIKNRNGQLDKVPKPATEGEGDGGLTDMMTSPTQTRNVPGEEIDEFAMQDDCFVDAKKNLLNPSGEIIEEGVPVVEGAENQDMLASYKGDKVARD
jgi:hypothetical protein